jgi:hypothetical protein
MKFGHPINYMSPKAQATENNKSEMSRYRLALRPSAIHTAKSRVGESGVGGTPLHSKHGQMHPALSMKQWKQRPKTAASGHVRKSN